MHPTMKLRWVPTEWHEHLSSPKVETIRGKYVLQQWWEGAKSKKEYEHLAPGSIIHWDGKEPLMTYEPYGEWRDIEVQNEQDIR